MADPEGAGYVMYGPLLAWSWMEGVPFILDHGWLEPKLTPTLWAKVMDDALAVLTGIARDSAVALHPDLRRLPSLAL